MLAGLLLMRKELRFFSRPSLAGVAFIIYLTHNLLPGLYVWYVGFPFRLGDVPLDIGGTALGSRKISTTSTGGPGMAAKFG